MAMALGVNSWVGRQRFLMCLPDSPMSYSHSARRSPTTRELRDQNRSRLRGCALSVLRLGLPWERAEILGAVIRSVQL